MSKLWDVIIVGAGPAGSAAAAALGKAGIPVLVLEKDEFPRFHVGESLLPASGIAQSLMGAEPDPSIYVFKRGAQFICEQTGRNATFDFAEALPGPPRHAYHVDRPLFDKQLRDRAAALGAEIRHGVRVSGVDIDDAGVTVKTDHGQERCRFVIDATGQDRLLGRAQRSIEGYQHFGKAANFTHFEGISDEVLAEFIPHNDVRILMIEDGWAWVIPIPGKRLSVGMVSRKQGALSQDSILRYVASSPLLRRWTAGASPRPPRMIGNFSFLNTKSHGSRFASIGDAACFIDPVFSSGVALALHAGTHLAEILIPALATGNEADPNLAAKVKEHMQPAYDSFCSLVYRFYNTRFVDNVFFGAPTGGDLRASVVSVLAGDVLRPDNAFRDMLLSSRSQPWRKTQAAPGAGASSKGTS